MNAVPRRYWQDMSTADFADLDAEATVAVLPVGAIEQHGPHLPVVTDTCINEGILTAALERVPAGLPVTVLPTMPVGKSNEHIAFPGTLTLSAATLTALWTELGEGVARAGLRKLLLFNSHGGQPQIMDIVARDLRVRLNMMVVSYSWPNHGMPTGLFPEAEYRFGIHGGAIETAMMLHLRPDLVREDAIDDFPPLLADLDRDFEILNLIGPAATAWQAQDIHPSGTAGNARLATAEAGRTLVEAAAASLATLIAEVSRYPLANLASGPLDRQALNMKR